MHEHMETSSFYHNPAKEISICTVYKRKLRNLVIFPTDGLDLSRIVVSGDKKVNLSKQSEKGEKEVHDEKKTDNTSSSSNSRKRRR